MWNMIIYKYGNGYIKIRNWVCVECLHRGVGNGGKWGNGNVNMGLEYKTLKYDSWPLAREIQHIV